MFFPKLHDSKTIFVHYARLTLKFLQAVNIVDKSINLTDLSQCRPIEDIFRILAQLVYQNGWTSTDLKQLSKQIKMCLTNAVKF